MSGAYTPEVQALAKTPNWRFNRAVERAMEAGLDVEVWKLTPEPLMERYAVLISIPKQWDPWPKVLAIQIARYNLPDNKSNRFRTFAMHGDNKISAHSVGLFVRMMIEDMEASIRLKNRTEGKVGQ